MRDASSNSISSAIAATKDEHADESNVKKVRFTVTRRDLSDGLEGENTQDEEGGVVGASEDVGDADEVGTVDRDVAAVDADVVVVVAGDVDVKDVVVDGEDVDVDEGVVGVEVVVERKVVDDVEA